MAGVSIKVVGAEQAALQARAAAARALDPAPVWDEIGAMLTVSTRRRFEEERDPAGTPWPRSIRTLIEGGKTLSDTGRLAGSLTHEVIGDGVMVGTDVLYAAVHQFGATITAKTDQGLMFRIGDQFVRKQSVTIPQRAFLGVDEEDELQIAGIWEDYLGEPLGEVSRAG